MKEDIIKRMSGIVNDVMESNKTDFTVYDKESLKDYDGRFMWFVSSSGTLISKISDEKLMQFIESEQGLYSFMQRNTDIDAHIAIAEDGRWNIFVYDGNDLLKISHNVASIYWESIRNAILFRWHIENGMQELPADFSIKIEFFDDECEKYYREQLEYANAHNDDSLYFAVKKLTNRVKLGSDHKIIISRDFTDRSFLFREEYGGKPHLCGGIIFHGYPDEGYKSARSYQDDKQYGWQTHT